MTAAKEWKEEWKKQWKEIHEGEESVNQSERKTHDSLLLHGQKKKTISNRFGNRFHFGGGGLGRKNITFKTIQSL